MNFINKYLILSMFFLLSLSFSAFSSEKLRIFSWDGYVTANDIINVNKILKSKKLDVQIELINPLASGPEQMFDVIRAKKCDVAFLTLFFIKMNKEAITKLLEPININSKRLSNYRDMLPGVNDLEMGMKDGKHLYLPFGGGVYGFWANMAKVSEEDFPKGLNDLWHERWYKKISLNKTQIWYNVGITLMSLELKPFLINDLLAENNRNHALIIAKDHGNIQNKLNALYKQAANFWVGGTEFKPELEIVSSWGPEMERRNKNTNEKWKLIPFKEGNIVWLDTINFVKGLKGNKLIAAEHFANYFMGEKVQRRVVEELSMISVSSKIKNNPRVNENPLIFKTGNFVPPYSEAADNIMQALSRRAMNKVKLDNLKK